MSVAYAIRKIENVKGPEPWYDGERFRRDRKLLKEYATRAEADEAMEVAANRSYVPVEVFEIPCSDS